MTHYIEIKNVKIGDGAPKICVPIMGATEHEILKQAQLLNPNDIDMVEWRADYFSLALNTEKVIKTAKNIRKFLPSLPLLFTFRTKQEGGEKEITTADYLALNLAMAESGIMDLIDLELFITEHQTQLQEVIDKIHAHGRKVILSNHDFKQTPSKEEIIDRLKRMQELNCDLPKIAVMPHTTTDVITLLNATHEMKQQYADRPIITMSMGKLGAVSRICGETFGSAITFASASQASAPGQLPIAALKNILTLLHA